MNLCITGSENTCVCVSKMFDKNTKFHNSKLVYSYASIPSRHAITDIVSDLYATFFFLCIYNTILGLPTYSI